MMYRYNTNTLDECVTLGMDLTTVQELRPANGENRSPSEAGGEKVLEGASGRPLKPSKTAQSALLAGLQRYYFDVGDWSELSNDQVCKAKSYYMRWLLLLHSHTQGCTFKTAVHAGSVAVTTFQARSSIWSYGRLRYTFSITSRQSQQAVTSGR